MVPGFTRPPPLEPLAIAERALIAAALAWNDAESDPDLTRGEVMGQLNNLRAAVCAYRRARGSS